MVMKQFMAIHSNLEFQLNIQYFWNICDYYLDESSEFLALVCCNKHVLIFWMDGLTVEKKCVA